MNLQDYISRLSDKYGIPSQLSLATAKVLTNMEMRSSKFDPFHEWLWDCQAMAPFRKLTDDEVLSSIPPEGFNHHLTYLTDPATEYNQQKTGWGPFLQKGSEARSAGYIGPFTLFTEDPETAVHFFLIQLSKLRDKYFDKHGWAGVMAAYDIGRPRMIDGVYTNRDFLIELNKAGAKKYLSYR